MRIIHKGYAATTYGKTSLSVTDREGREVYHDDSREVDSYTDMELRLIIEELQKDKNDGE